MLQHKYAPSNNQGFTLIEFLVAIVIMMVGLMALLQCVNVAIVRNLENQYRDGAVSLADERLAAETAKTFTLISSAEVSRLVIPRPINNTFKNYSVIRSGSTMPDVSGLPLADRDSSDDVYSKIVNIRVSWRYKNNRFEHTMSGMASRSRSNSPNIR